MIFVVYYPDSTSHLAIGLTGLGPDKNICISFFPPKLSSKAGFRLHQLNHDRYVDDKKIGSRAATVIVLPSEESCSHGLSEQAVYDWWAQFNAQEECFSWFTNNCSSIVYKALHEAQTKSASLQHRLLVEKTWFCTPGNVLSYAKAIGDKLLQPQTLEGELFYTFAEIKGFCELGQQRDPFSQLYPLFLRIKQFADKNISLILTRPFCVFVQEILNELNHSDEQVEAVNTEIFYQKLVQLFKSAEASKDVANIQRLQTLIAEKLLAPISAYIDTFLPHMYQERVNITKVLNDASHKIDESKNPKREYVDRADPTPPEFRHGTFSRM